MRNQKELDVETSFQARLNALEAQARSARWWRRTALLLIVAALCFPFAAEALGPVPNTFASGDVISAMNMNDNFTHLQNAITAVEGKLPTAACGPNQMSQYTATGWVCADDATLTTTDPNLSIDSTARTISLSPNLSVNSVNTSVLDLGYGFQWYNSVSNAAPEMSRFSHTSCTATTRGRLRIMKHEDIGNSMDIGDALCFCQLYLDRTPTPDVEYYRWVCMYPQSDGN